MDVALIGNGSYQALIDRRARVRWLCWPRFDSSFVIGSLLDEDEGGAFEVIPSFALRDTEQAYLPNSNVLRTVLRGDGVALEVIDVAPRAKGAAPSSRPRALMRILRPLEGKPRLRLRCEPVYDYGREQAEPRRVDGGLAWSLGEGLRLRSSLPPEALEGAEVPLEREEQLILAWGSSALPEDAARWLAETTRYWEDFCARLALPARHREEVTRSALTLALHQYDDTGAVTAAATTSLPEYPGAGRNWDYRFTWPRDGYFTVAALARLGHRDPLAGYARFLVGLVPERGPCRLQPLYGIGGEERIEEEELDHLAGFEGNRPVRIGNAAYAQVQHDVYGEVLGVIAPLFDEPRHPFADEPALREALPRLLSAIDEQLDAPDAGLWEIRDEPKVHTFSLLLHWYGATLTRRIGETLGDEPLASRAAALAARAGRAMEEGCWNEEAGFYADAVSTEHPDAALMMMVNLGYLDPRSARARSHVERLAERLSAGDGLMHRYLHHDGIGQTHAAFTVCGFWYAEALARIGDRERAEEVFTALLRHQNHVGLYSEDVDPRTGRQLGNFPQTYSHVGLIQSALALAGPSP